MTDLDELRVALKSGEYDGTHIMRAWLLVDKVKVLEAKLDKAKEALKWIAKVNAMDSEYVRVARQALEELDK